MSAGHSFDLTDEERRMIVISLRRSRDNADHALMELHPNHPRRAVVVLERRKLDDLLETLSIDGD